ncbi:MAG: 4-hydroxythreonine-4-phosphate dehydrogenase PdxA [Candidatus Azobacteroides sp.]|nr:4-hydroxythreonine-4-phosphate dehydrogenase PdxA [Candidatus Azobacteroides sp.]
MIKVGITHGDINGIGYEVILKTLSDAKMLEFCTPVIYGSAKVAAYHRKALDLSNISMNTVNDARNAVNNRINIINCIDDEIKVELSKSTQVAGEAAFASLKRAVSDIKDGLIDVLVTAPINKNNIQNEHFKFPGHTEYLQEVLGNGKNALMILTTESLRVALVTGHIPLSEVPKILTIEKIVLKLKDFSESLIADFGITGPRIAVLSLNPHAGEAGLLGNEEKEVIIPAIQEAEKQGVLCYGPYASDGFFGSGTFEKFDGVLAMYHDQGLAPFKTLAMESGVNFTAGLPFVRTSPDHGTAYDIAGKNIASENSFRNALYMAVDIFHNRKLHREATKNPLKKQYFERGSDNEKLDLSSE